ncbi:GNAT family N-acetyltransferase [Epilithonimonas arachidiradicis]|uniref:Phosphinothricin acetyltransferase n=1 Tax=Epilithonimonas arachidiradicis TaxID=1617282 RepID=A0A420DA24_9FLAO|nr:GNAT family N-acetyltransferase [Epilithonimonas arachidiradicis]RKE88130.1 phosphinothricin acetyltransferase [Epilithonimonas arachidiradicis]GGG51135.1 phosphinothricin acetyltransferase [Epilithonimonas arachidiradicis]
MTFRDATLDDLPKIVEIYNSTVASRLVTADLEPVSVESKLDWFHQHNSEFRPLWMVEDSQKNTIGWVSFQDFYGRPAYQKTAEISIYLSEQSRGKGYGKQILESCIEKAPNLGIENLLAFIFAHNLPSLTLFEKFGFELWANLKNIAELDGEKRSLIILGKNIKN